MRLRREAHTRYVYIGLNTVGWKKYTIVRKRFENMAGKKDEGIREVLVEKKNE